MKIKHSAVAGTIESSDALVTVEEGRGIELSIESPVIHQFGAQIKATVINTLKNLDVDDVKISVIDKGALDCTLKARVEAAVYRACDEAKSDVPWGGAVK